LDHFFSRIRIEYATFYQPAEKRLNGGDPPGERFGTAGDFAVLLQPGKIIFKISRADCSDGLIGRQKAFKQCQVSSKGFKRVMRSALIPQINFPCLNSGLEKGALLDVRANDFRLCAHDVSNVSYSQTIEF